LLLQGSSGLVNLVRKNLEEPPSSRKIRESLVRLGTNSPQDGNLRGAKSNAPARGTAASKTGDRRAPRVSYDLEHHTAGKPEAIVDLFNKLDQRLMAFGPDVERVFRKEYINYKVKKSFVTLRLDRGQLVMYAAVPLHDSPRPTGLSISDVSTLGKLGLGDTKISVADESDLEGAEQVARTSYERTPPLRSLG